jgi:hypothetical protein
MLKLARHIGQLFARSTQGLRHSLCRSWPHGSRCAIISSSLLDFIAAFWVLVGCWCSPSAPSSSGLVASDDPVAEGASSWGTRSPRQTIQVSAIGMVFGSERAKVLVDAIHKLGRWSSRESGDHGLSTRILASWPRIIDHSRPCSSHNP